jgi:hypothetical protein
VAASRVAELSRGIAESLLEESSVEDLVHFDVPAPKPSLKGEDADLGVS